MRKGFTLIELIVVLAIGAILVACFYPLFVQATGMKAQQKADKLAGCTNPVFVQAISNTHGWNGDIRTDTKYIYKCDEGRVIELDETL